MPWHDRDNLSMYVAGRWRGCRARDSGYEHSQTGEPARYAGGRTVIGNDIARRRHLWVAWVLKLVGVVAWTREVKEFKNASFAEQDDTLGAMVERYRPSRSGSSVEIEMLPREVYSVKAGPRASPLFSHFSFYNIRVSTDLLEKLVLPDAVFPCHPRYCRFGELGDHFDVLFVPRDIVLPEYQET